MTDSEKANNPQDAKTPENVREENLGEMVARQIRESREACMKAHPGLTAEEWNEMARAFGVF